jgi:cAMP-dependent protein kinase regulator
VKAFVRNSAGRQVRVREMGEGSFFGEISILSGKPRTATITCATSCDLLELDRDALDGIAATHPRVQEVLMAFYYERHGSGEEKRVRGTQPAKG